MEKKNVAYELTFPLSTNQYNIWRLEMTFIGVPVNNICSTVRMSDRLDIPAIQKCLNRIVESDPSLRTRIHLFDDEPRQYHAEFLHNSWPVYDFSLSNERGLDYWEETITKEKMQIIDSPLFSFAIFKLSETQGGVLIRTHHIISDGWSQALLCSKIAKGYLEVLSEEETTFEEAPSYRIHLDNEQKYFSSSGAMRDKAFWQQQFSTPFVPAVIKDCKSADISPVGRRVTFRLPQTLNHEIYSYCLEHRVTPFSVFYMALAVYLQRLGNQGRISIGVPVFNRSNMTAKKTTGMFVSTLPFIFSMDKEWTFDEMRGHVMEDWYELLRHQRLPYDQIQIIARQQMAHKDLFNIVFSYQDTTVIANEDAMVTFSGQWHYSGYQAEHLCIHLTNLENERHYAVSYDYLTQMFSEDEIVKFHSCLTNLLFEALRNPERQVGRLNIISGKEKEQVLYTFNQTSRYNLHDTLYPVFRSVVKSLPTKVALIQNNVRITYQTLNSTGESYAAAIGQFGRNTVIAIYLPKGLSLFYAIVGVMISGNAWLLLSDDQPLERTMELIRDSGAALLVTSETQEAGRLCREEQYCPVLHVEDIRPDSKEKYIVPETKGEDLAYIVYTSGSTGKPKAVEIEQHSLVNFIMSTSFIFGRGAVLSICNVNFDAFLIESIAALLCGKTIVLPQEGETENPEAVAELITGLGVGVISTTPSRMLEYMKYPGFLRALRHMESIVCGGENYPSDLLYRLKLYTNANIYNQYGPSETTVGVATKCLNDATEITIGKPMDNCKLYVLDSYLQPLPVGIQGELYIGGQCVGRGYRGRPELTEASFMDNPYEIGQRMYKTGDSACWTPGGEIMVLGRKDSQIKLRGLRIEPQEIVQCIRSFPHIDEAAVKVTEVHGQQTLVAYYSAQRSIIETELYEFLATYLPSYMIPATLIQLSQMPLTSNGKVDYAALPGVAEQEKDFREDTFNGQKGWSTEQSSEASAWVVAEIFQKVLERQEMRLDDDYFAFGGNSLNAMEALMDMENTFGIRLRIADLYVMRTARKIARYLDQKRSPSSRDDFMGKGNRNSVEIPGNLIESVPLASFYPLSPAQRSIFIQSKLDGTKLAYHMPGMFRLPPGTDKERLSKAFQRLVETEELLRTCFVLQNGQAVQQVKDYVEWNIMELSGSLEEATAQFVRPFDLSQAPLFRCGFWQEEDLYLFLDFHHIINDGLSTAILMKKLQSLYMTGIPVENPISYKDYACWISDKNKGGTEEDRQYWKEQIKQLKDTLDIPTDYPRPKVFDFKGKKHIFSISQELTEKCKAYCRKNDISLFVFLMGVFGILLSKLSGQQDFTVGTPVSGRNNMQVRELFGCFINTLPLRISCPQDISVSSYFLYLKTEVIDLLDHQSISLEEIVEMAGIKPDLRKNPLYHVMFALRPLDSSAFTLDGRPLNFTSIETNTAKLDLNLEAAETEQEITFFLEYASSLFDPATIAMFGRSYVEILSSAIKYPGLSLNQLKSISSQDRIQLIEQPNWKRTPYINMCVDKIIDNEAELRENDAAILCHGSITTFGMLKQRSDELAEQLKQQGIRRGDAVALACRRGEGLILSMLAILKAGAAYVPILTSFPEKRIQYMISQAKAKMLLCDKESRKELSPHIGCPLGVIDFKKNGEKTMLTVSVKTDEADKYANLSSSEGNNEDGEQGARNSNDLMYILFTSGSTGQPKGVMIQHRSIANLLSSAGPLLKTTTGPVLCTTNVVFDIFIMETLLPLAIGHTVVMADEEEMMLPWKMAELIRSEGTTVMQLTPSRLQMCLNNDAFSEALSHIRLLILGGEALSHQLVSLTKQKAEGVSIINMYGPTEAAVYVTAGEMLEGRPVVIGQPLNNCRTYILDEELRHVMPGARGELYLAGECLSPGYSGKQDLTDQVFLGDPFFPGERMYRTGDLARLKPDGNIEYLGRRDDQIKLHGQRIEPEEINDTVIRSGMASEAATLYIKKEGGMGILRSYVVPIHKPSEKSPITEEEIRRYFRSELPEYMVPAEIILIEQLPKTASGKVDRQALKNIELKQNNDVKTMPLDTRVPEENKKQRIQIPEKREQVEHEIPAERRRERAIVDTLSSVEKKIAEVWKCTLGKENFDPEVSFFDQGGGSLAALNVLSLYFNEDWPMTMAQFYEHPTINGQAALIKSMFAGQGSPSEGPTKEEGKVEIAQELIHREYDAMEESEAVDVHWKNLKKFTDITLITGATGYFGAHLVKALLDSGQNTRLLCLVRGGDRERLLGVLSWYFGQAWTKGADPFIYVTDGDISQTNLGISDSLLAEMLPDVTRVIHAAADVRHYAADNRSIETNTKGTLNVIELSKKAQAQMIHISTISISGEYLCDEPSKKAIFTENDFDIGQNWMDNVYVKGKFLAEELVRKAIAEGLDGKIFRIGRLVGRRSDGVFQKNPESNSFYMLIKAISHVDVMPQSLANMAVEMTPVDECAANIVPLLEGKRMVYHMYNPHFVTLKEVWEFIRGTMPEVCDDEFSRHLTEQIRKGRAEKIAPLLEHWNRIKLQSFLIHPDCSLTLKELENSGIKWKDISVSVLLRTFQ